MFDPRDRGVLHGRHCIILSEFLHIQRRRWYIYVIYERGVEYHGEVFPCAIVDMMPFRPCWSSSILIQNHILLVFISISRHHNPIPMQYFTITTEQKQVCNGSRCDCYRILELVGAHDSVTCRVHALPWKRCWVDGLANKKSQRKTTIILEEYQQSTRY